MQDALLLWSVRLSLLGMVLGWCLRLAGRPKAARWCWTIGCDLMTLHVIFAFWFVHDWSHASAVEATAKDTLEVTGSAFGGGVWFNYVFLILWNVDGLWWWMNEPGYNRRPRWVSALFYGFLAFIAFNATVVFETGAMRAFGVAASILLVASLAHRARAKVQL